MDISEFYRESNRFIELYKSYSHETNQDSRVFYTGLKWLIELQSRAMNRFMSKKYFNSFSLYLSKPTSLQLKKILSEYCNDNNLIHFNAFSLIDTVSTKF